MVDEPISLDGPARGLRIISAIISAGAVVMIGAAAVLLVVAGPSAAYETGDVTLDLIGVLAFLPFVAAGLLLTQRLPRLSIGWILLLFALGAALQSVAPRAIAYTHIVLRRPDMFTEVLAVLGDALWVPGIALGFVGLLVLFPNGRVPARAWRWALGVAGVAAVLYFVVTIIARAPLFYLNSVTNPVGIVGGPDLYETGTSIAVLALFVVCIPAAVAALIYRWRRSDPQSRQQIRWLLWAAFVLIAGVIGSLIGSALIKGPVSGGWTGDAMDVLSATLPVAIVIAVTRHGLYKIDRIVSRTASYTLMAIVLGAVYAGGVIGLQALLPESGDVAVAASTLLAASIFSPLRRRIQGWFDRRFDRHRYDAQQIVQTFSARHRDAVDLDTLMNDLHRVMADTVAPGNASIWLKVPDNR